MESVVAEESESGLSVKQCWVCRSNNLKLVKESSVQGALTGTDFAISDKRYGVTGTLSQCMKCGFVQCSDIENVSQFYEDLIDPDY